MKGLIAQSITTLEHKIKIESILFLKPLVYIEFIGISYAPTLHKRLRISKLNYKTAIKRQLIY
jgi:hypothetical protein